MPCLQQLHLRPHAVDEDDTTFEREILIANDLGKGRLQILPRDRLLVLYESSASALGRIARNFHALSPSPRRHALAVVDFR